MRTAIRRLLSLGAVIVALLLGATQASAGGPTSVLISNPATDSAAALYRSDADYRTLLDALEPAGEPAVAPGPGDIGAGSINITWLIHDVTVWRTDFVHLGSEDQVLVQTNTAPEGTSISWESTGEWQVAADPQAVLDVLERAGVLSPKSSTGAEASVDAKAATDAKTESALGANGGQDEPASLLTGWWWLLPGAAIGIALGLGARPLAAELARRREPGPRHQLIG